MHNSTTQSRLASSIPLSKNFNNWFNGNTTNFGSKAYNLSPLIFSTKNIVEPKLLDGWFSGNKTNFGSKSYPLNNFYYRPV